MIVKKMIGGIMCLALAEAFRRFSFIAPDWEGELSQEKLLSCLSLLCGGCCLILAAGLFSEAFSQIKERKALERAYLRAKKAEEEERRRQARKMTFRNWRNTTLVVLALLCLFSGKVWALDGKDLERVCSRLSQAAGRPVEVVIEQNNDLNAWASGDGRLGVTSGMLAALEEEDELAFVIAHEVSHLQGGHHLRQRNQASLGGLLGALAAKALGGKEKAVKLGVELGAGLLAGSESRQDEYEADKNALILVQKAGFRPEAAVAVLKRLQSRYGNGDAKVPVIGWFASHPDTGNRVKRLEALLGRDAPSRSRLQRGRKAVVVVDPEARRYDYGWGFRSYYDQSLSETAKIETEAVLGEQGWTVLVSTQDVGPIQEELALENSEWGRNGEGRKDIGSFAGADDIFYVSAYVASETAYTAGNWRQSARLEGLKVGVVLRQIDLKTRKQLNVFRATGSAQALRRARIVLGQGDPLEAEFEQADDLARRAVRAAIANALN